MSCFNTSPDEIAAVLDLSAELLETEYGWIRGSIARDHDGNPVFARDPRAVSVCLLGAVEIAAYRLHDIVDCDDGSQCGDICGAVYAEADAGLALEDWVRIHWPEAAQHDPDASVAMLNDRFLADRTDAVDVLRQVAEWVREERR